MNQYLFFDSSKSIYNLITNLFDFIWPTSVALWNQRFIVQGYIKVNPNATQAELVNRFSTGSGIKGLNLKKTLVEQSWDEQQEKFAQILLINLLSLYESWIEMTLDAIKKNTSRNCKGLQFPLGSIGDNYENVLLNINSDISDHMKNIYYSSFLKHKKNSESKINNLLIIYRVFKEIRNCLVHEAGSTNKTLIDAYTKFIQEIHDPTDLGVKEIPIILPLTINTKIDLSLRGVVGFSEIVHRLITTFDAKLSINKESEKIFIDKWRLINAKIQLPSNSDRKILRLKQLNRKVFHFDLDNDSNYLELERMLKSYGLII